MSVPVPQGTSTLYVDRVPHAVTAEDGYATVAALGAGCHVLSAERDSDAHLDPTLTGVCRSPPVVDPGHGPSGCVAELLRQRE